ncbi:hypothetical protein ABPG72_014755, partial [Tetrahymena utriculariae]
MKSQAVLLVFVLFGFVYSQNNNKTCSYNYSQQTCVLPCVFTPDQNSFVCQSKCSRTCYLTVKACSYIQGSSISQQQCLQQNINCVYAPPVKEDCIVLDNVKQSCPAKANDYNGCIAIKIVLQLNNCEANQNFQCSNTPSCDSSMCDYTPCAQKPGIDCSSYKSSTDCKSGNCAWNSKDSVCNDNCTNQTADTCPQDCIAKQCVSNSDKQSKYCKAFISDPKCAAGSTRCKVTSQGTCDSLSTLCSVTSNLNVSCPFDSCQYISPKDPTCKNPICTKGYQDKCDPYCAPIPPRCIPNGLSSCETLKTQSDFNNNTAFCSYSQS